jgi:hypothetical protein
MLFLVAGAVYAQATKNEVKPRSVFLRTKDKWIIAGVCVVASLIFIYAVALPYRKTQIMNQVYEESLPNRAQMWSSLSGISPMGDEYDSELMFSDIYKAYSEQADSVKDGSRGTKKAVLDELDSINEYLIGLLERRPDNYALTLTAARLHYLRMYIAQSYTKQTLDRAQALARHALGLSPTDPRALDIYQKLSR